MALMKSERSIVLETYFHEWRLFKKQKIKN